MCCGPRRAEEKNMCGSNPEGRVPVGRRPQVVQAHIHEVALTSVGPCWLLFVPSVVR